MTPHPRDGYGRAPSRCFSCERPFSGPTTAHGLPSRGWVAYDIDTTHLWVICERCRSWNLVDQSERFDTVDRLEWECQARGVRLGESRNVQLIQLADRLVVRIGSADLPERASWRYGHALRRRRARFTSPFTVAGAAAYGALSYLGESVGLVDRRFKVTLDSSGLADLVRWRRFGWAAWRGRRTCPNCGSVLRALPYSSSWSLRPVDTEAGLTLSVPCPRCDFWTPENVYHMAGHDAEHTLLRVLAYQHVEGVADETIHSATGLLERAGSVRELCRNVTANGETLWRMPLSQRVALEIAVNQMAEERLLANRVQALVATWRKEHVLAEIQDAEL